MTMTAITIPKSPRYQTLLPLLFVLTAAISLYSQLRSTSLLQKQADAALCAETAISVQSAQPPDSEDDEQLPAPRILPRTLREYKSRDAYDEMEERILTTNDLDTYYYDNPGSLYYGMRDEPLIFFITPTYQRSTQLVDLFRVQQAMQADALQGVLQVLEQPAQAQRKTNRGLIYWIVVEDSTGCSKKVRNLLEEGSSTIPFAHIAVLTPPELAHLGQGRAQRNAALQLIRDYFESKRRYGIVYFGDDDNGYHVQLFSELRKIKRFGTFPVAFVGGSTYERCNVNETTGLVEGMHVLWAPERKFALDMAAFGFHSSLLRRKNMAKKTPKFMDTVRKGNSESRFVKQLIQDITELEPLAQNCTRVYAYHVKSSDGNQTEMPPEDALAEEIIMGL